MGKAIPYDNRVKIIERMEKGETAEELAEEMGYSEGGVKKIWYKYQKEGTKAYDNNYGNCGKKSSYGEKVRGAVKEIRDNKQGGCYVRSKLIQKHPGLVIPSERTLQRWWVTEQTNREKGRPKKKEKKDGAEPLTKDGK